VFCSIIDFTLMILSCQNVLDNDWIVDVAKIDLGTHHSFLSIFVLNHHVSVLFFRHLVCKILPGIYVAIHDPVGNAHIVHYQA
jgi:hypothetical protein